MPHTDGKRYAVVSCHVERPLDDACWELFASFQASRPGGFRVAALMRPPDATAGEDEGVWLDRARIAAAHGAFGQHTHFVGPRHARPDIPSPEHAARVRAEGARLREHGLEARFFCGGGWYIDEGVAEAIAELGYVDCTGTAFRPSYLAPDAPRLAASTPVWLELPSGARLLELPVTHTIGMVARAALGSLGRYLHIYFHDTDLLERPRRSALRVALELLSRRADVTDLASLSQAQDAAPVQPFGQAAEGASARGA